MDIVTIALMMLSFIGAVCVCSFAGPIGRGLFLVDHPGGLFGRKRHRAPTPLVGGFAVIPVSLGAMLFLAAGTPAFAPFAALAAVTGGMLLLGILDDRLDLPARPRLLYSALFIVIAVAVFPEFRMRELVFAFLDAPLEIGAVGGGLLTVIAILGFQNAVNMADGRNGLVIGLCLVWSLLLLPVAPPVVQQTLLVLASGLAAVFAFNIRGKLFLGDSGSYSVSVLLAFLSLYSFNAAPAGLPSSDMLVLFFWIPTLDTLRLIWMRLARNRTPFQPDRRHLHHFLGDVMPWSAGLALYLGLVMVPGALALAVPALAPPMLLASTAAYSAVLVLCARKLRSRMRMRFRHSSPQAGRLVAFKPEKDVATVRLTPATPMDRPQSGDDVKTVRKTG